MATLTLNGYTPSAGPSVRNTATSGSTAYANTFAPTMPTRSAGDVLLIIHACYSDVTARTFTQPSGWTTVQGNRGATGQSLACHYMVSVTGSEAPTITVSGTGIHACTVYSISGGAGVDVISAVNTDKVAPTVTTTGTNRLLVSGCGTRTNTTVTVAGGQTSVTQATGTDSASEFVSSKTGWEVVAAAGATGTRTFGGTTIAFDAPCAINVAVN